MKESKAKARLEREQRKEENQPGQELKGAEEGGNVTKTGQYGYCSHSRQCGSLLPRLENARKLDSTKGVMSNYIRKLIM